MDLFGAVHGWGGQKRPPSLKSVTHILKMMKLGSYTLPKEDPKKYMNHVTHPLSFSADTSICSPEISIFCYIKRYRCRLYFDR